MSVRDAISGNPGVGTAAAAGLALIGALAVFLHAPTRSAPVHHDQCFFTTDDGKTWFADRSTNIPPFDKDGKQAVRAYVFRAADGTEFVDYLERFKPEARQVLEQANSPTPGQKGPDETVVRAAFTDGRQVKRPGDASWTDGGDMQAAAQVRAVKCPDGSSTGTPVEP